AQTPAQSAETGIGKEPAAAAVVATRSQVASEDVAREDANPVNPMASEAGIEDASGSTAGGDDAAAGGRRRRGRRGGRRRRRGAGETAAGLSAEGLDDNDVDAEEDGDEGDAVAKVLAQRGQPEFEFDE